MCDFWQSSQGRSKLPEDEVHIWRIWLDAVEHVSELTALLSAGEKERAEHFYWQRDQNRFVVARATLRCILGHYLDASPTSLHFTLSTYGKPRLTGIGKLLAFNLSHSDSLALIAVSWRRMLGIDVERLRNDFDYERLAARFFSPAEAVELAAIDDEEERVKAFFRCWTRKEAYIKGQGKGMVLGLRSFDVTLAPGEGARLVATRPDAAEAGRWQLRDLQPAPGYEGALAVKGQDWTLRCWTWAEETMG